MGATATDADREGGFGLVEVVIAMFLLALIAVAMLPTFASAMKLSAQNVLIGRATGLTRQHLAQAVDVARQSGASCGTVLAALHSGTEAAPNADLDYRFTVSPAVCPASAISYPTTLTVTVTITRHGDARELATARTELAVLRPPAGS